MARLARENALALAGAAAGIAILAWLGLYGFAWTDYESEAAPALAALTAGHVGRFLSLAPAYGGSLILRVPFALVPTIWGGGQLAVYRMVALPCLLAAAGLGVWLVAEMRRLGHSRLARGCALGLCVASPISLRALEIGHPEEILGGVLCVAAVLLARSSRSTWAGVALGLALATKAWALVAVAPVILALPFGHPRLRATMLAVAVAAVVLVPLALSPGGRYLSSSGTAAQTGTIFQPWQAWWWLGRHGKVVRGSDGQIKPGFRSPPAWVNRITHPLIVLLSIPLAVLWLRRRQRRPWEPMGLLALLLLLRCVLDPWNNVYYAIPFLLALLAFEVLTRRDVPALSLATTVAVWVTFQYLPSRLSADAQSAAYLAWALPLAGGLALWLYAPHRWSKVASMLRPPGGTPALFPSRLVSRRRSAPSESG